MNEHPDRARMLLACLPGTLMGCVVLLIALRLGSPDRTAPSDSAPSTTPRASPRLTLKPDCPVTREHLGVILEVENPGPDPLGWDSKWSAFLSWTVHFNGDTLVIANWVYERLDPSEDDISRERFVLIEPNGKLVRRLVLTTGHRRCDYSVHIPEGHQHTSPIQVYRELQERLNIPEEVHSEKVETIQVQVVYDSVREAPGPGFEGYFGFEPKEAALWSGRFASNRISLNVGPSSEKWPEVTPTLPRQQVRP